MITDGTGHSITNYSHYYEKRMVEFGSNKKKRYLKIIINNERSQLILWYSLLMRNAHDTKELINILSTMDAKIIKRMKYVIGDKGYDAEIILEIGEEKGLKMIITAKNKDVPIHRTKGIHRKRIKKHLPEMYHRRVS